MRIKKDFVLRDVCGDPVIMNVGLQVIDFSKLIILNESAEWLWKEAQAQDNFTAESLIARACEEFDTTPQEAEAFVTEFLEQLEKEGVIEK